MDMQQQTLGTNDKQGNGKWKQNLIKDVCI